MRKQSLGTEAVAIVSATQRRLLLFSARFPRATGACLKPLTGCNISPLPDEALRASHSCCLHVKGFRRATCVTSVLDERLPLEVRRAIL